MTVIQNISREDIYHDISQLILHSPERESEVSIVDMAKKYGISSPTMDYHIKKLVEEGKIIQTESKGKYNRKMYTLPENQFEHLHKGLGDQQTFMDFMEEKKPEPSADISLTDLPLDEHIRVYLNKVNGTISSNEVLVKEDKEILSVTTETLQQTMVFIKDIMDQLTTVKSKDLINRLVEERNQHLEEIRKLREDKVELQELLQSKQNATVIDPQRVRFMQQILMATIDNYVSQANVSLTMNRTEFRDQAFKEIKDLVDYVLKITN